MEFQPSFSHDSGEGYFLCLDDHDPGKTGKQPMDSGNCLEGNRVENT
ncbi:MAG: hypothetical protein LUG96_06855 [Tannerellaceae bacterium]|nr:hypothetical protein [Tannerellaceae bacterium]